MSDFFAALLTAFLLVAPAELADKTLILSTALGGDKRWKKSAVAVGAATAFLGTMLFSVTVGEAFFRFVPNAARYGLIALFFAYWAWKFYQDYRDWMPEEEDADQPERSWWRQAGSAASMLAIAEIGDKSMFAAGGAAAKSGEFMATFLGSWAGITIVVLVGLVFGRVVGRFIKPKPMLGFATFIFIAVTVWSGWQFYSAL